MLGFSLQITTHNYLLLNYLNYVINYETQVQAQKLYITCMFGLQYRLQCTVIRDSVDS